LEEIVLLNDGVALFTPFYEQKESEMKRKQVKKLWLGKFVSVRDYELKDAIREGGLIIEHDGEQMRMSVEDVKQITPSGKFHKAKFAGNIQSYQLCDITWKPSNDEQKEMF
jgi:hypothetical protein